MASRSSEHSSLAARNRSADAAPTQSKKGRKSRGPNSRISKNKRKHASEKQHERKVRSGLNGHEELDDSGEMELEDEEVSDAGEPVSVEEAAMQQQGAMVKFPGPESSPAATASQEAASDTTLVGEDEEMPSASETKLLNAELRRLEDRNEHLEANNRRLADTVLEQNRDIAALKHINAMKNIDLDDMTEVIRIQLQRVKLLESANFHGRV